MTIFFVIDDSWGLTFRRKNGFDALKVHTAKKIWKRDLNIPNICFRLSIWPNGHRESQKYEFVKWIPRTNEAAVLFFLSPYLVQKHADSHSHCLFSPGNTWISSPEILLTPLTLLVSNTPCQVKLILSPKQRAKPKTSARRTGRSMPHCVAR